MFKNARVYQIIKNTMPIALSIGLAAYVFQSIDYTETLNRLQAVSTQLICFSFFMLAMQLIVQVKRWSIILLAFGIKIKSRTLHAIYWIGLFWNQLLPSSIGGDIARVAISKVENVSYVDLTFSVLAERVFGLISLFILGFIVLQLADTTSPIFASIQQIAYATALLLLLAAVALWRAAKKPPSFLQHFSLKITKRFPFILQIQKTFLAIIDYRTVVAILLSSVAGHIFYLVMMVFVFINITAINIDTAFIATMCLVMLITAIPISLAGWGVRESALVILTAQFGVTAEEATACGILIGLLTLIYALPGFVFFLLHLGKLGQKPS